MSTGFSQSTRDTILERDGNRCVRCGSSDALELHHRRSRGMGGTSKSSVNGAANGVTLCGGCHRRVESNRAEAYETGWAIRRSDTRNEEEIPAVTLYDGRVWFDNHGGVTYDRNC